MVKIVINTALALFFMNLFAIFISTTLFNLTEAVLPFFAIVCGFLSGKLILELYTKNALDKLKELENKQ